MNTHVSLIVITIPVITYFLGFIIGVCVGRGFTFKD
jgi:hypothetical protein